MKKTIAIIATALVVLSASAHNIIGLSDYKTFGLSEHPNTNHYGFPGGRLTIGMDYAWQDTPVQFSGGLFVGRPDRSIHLNVGYRLWQHWEAGIYIAVQGGNCSSGGTFLPQGGGYIITQLYVDKGVRWTNGVMVQYHIVPFQKRNDSKVDGVLRLGFTPGGEEIDNIWGGIGIIYSLADNVSLLMNGDLGSFRPSRLINNLMSYDAMPTRISLGLQVAL